MVYGGVHPEIGKRVAIKVLGPQATAPRLRSALQRKRRQRRQQDPPPAHHRHLRVQSASGRPPLLRHGVPGRGEPHGSPRPGAHGVRRDAAPPRPDLRRARGGARGRRTVHSDLQPGHISGSRRSTLSESGIKLLDFGIAKLNDLTNARSTQSGVPMGTPLYMPPEQGMGRKVDRRADIYALGVLLYQIFAGTLPFYGASGYEVVLKHVTEPPLPPSRAPSHLAEGDGGDHPCVPREGSGAASGVGEGAGESDRSGIRGARQDATWKAATPPRRCRASRRRLHRRRQAGRSSRRPSCRAGSRSCRWPMRPARCPPLRRARRRSLEVQDAPSRSEWPLAPW